MWNFARQRLDAECWVFQQFKFTRDLRKWPGEFRNAGHIDYGPALPSDCLGWEQQPSLTILSKLFALDFAADPVHRIRIFVTRKITRR